MRSQSRLSPASVMERSVGSVFLALLGKAWTRVQSIQTSATAARYTAFLWVPLALSACISTGNVVSPTPSTRPVVEPQATIRKSDTTAITSDTQVTPDGSLSSTSARSNPNGADARKYVAPQTDAATQSEDWPQDIERVFLDFEDGTSVVDESSKALLRRHAAILKAHPDWMVTLVGHLHLSGSPSFKLALAERRMDAVRKLLRSFGVGIDRVRWRSEGAIEPDVPCPNETCTSSKQGVELRYSSKPSRAAEKPRLGDAR